MAFFIKSLAIVILSCPLVSTADCDIRNGSCASNLEDDTNFMQVKLNLHANNSKMKSHPIPGTEHTYDENPNKFFIGDPYWVLKKVGTSSPIHYKVTSSTSVTLNAGFVTENFVVADNTLAGTTVAAARTIGIKTGRKLANKEKYYKQYKAIKGDHTGETDHWITFHVCDILANADNPTVAKRTAQIVKIGTSDIEDYWVTVKDEVQRAVKKSYAYCKPGTIMIYVYGGAASEAANDKLEECLRLRLMPASEENDITAADACSDSNVSGKAKKFYQRAIKDIK